MSFLRQTLDMSPYIEDPEQKSRDNTYHLIGVIRHGGCELLLCVCVCVGMCVCVCVCVCVCACVCVCVFVFEVACKI